MFGKSKGDTAEEDRDIGSAQELQRSTATPGASEATSSISSGLSIVGKIVGHGAVTIFGHVEGELHASTVVIAEGGKVEGDIVAMTNRVQPAVAAAAPLWRSLFVCCPLRTAPTMEGVCGWLEQRLRFPYELWSGTSGCARCLAAVDECPRSYG